LRSQSNIYQGDTKDKEQVCVCVCLFLSSHSQLKNVRIIQKLSKLKREYEWISKEIYGAKGVTFTPAAKKQIEKINKIGLSNLPICMAKTQYSLSDNPALLGRPQNFEMTIREVRPSAGAGFVVAITGDILTMPGLPKIPSTEKIDMDNQGKISGLF
jgi:formate--tetrahydrofolate ligase